MTAIADHRSVLRGLPADAWDAYLAANSCWSVAVAAAPVDGFARLERLAAVDDPDARWIVRENLKKARLARADSARTEQLRARPG